MTALKKIDYSDITKKFFVIAGPCVIESKEHVFFMAEKLLEICVKNEVPLIFKASYDKANRSSVKSYRGPGIKEGLKILRDVKSKFGLPIISDVHNEKEVKEAAKVLDVLQIPALLCRQTDLISAAAKTGKMINLKKGQFIAPQDMKNIVEKAEAGGNRQILLTERGTMFGYNNLVVDMRCFKQLKESGYPVVFDATHSVQLPGALGKASGGERKYVSVLAKAAVAAGVDGLFLEIHDNPQKALCDGPNMIDLKTFENLLSQVKAINNIVRE
ncbi:MAG: 3-deoxy-8-phosphooctulonate synthase [Candidatus Omnitrophota bacterium]